MSVVCCPVDISATDRSLVQRSPTKCGVSECDRGTSFEEASTNQGCPAMIIYIYSYNDSVVDFVSVVCLVLYF